MQKGYTIIFIILTVFALMLFTSYLCIDNFYTNKVNEELKADKDNLRKELKECNKEPEPDLRIFWQGNDAYFLKDCVMQKVKDINHLIQLVANGYKS